MEPLTELRMYLLEMLVRVRDLVTNSDIVSGAVLDLVLVWLGSKIIGESKKKRLWSGRLAFLCMLAYATDAILQIGPSTADELILIAVKSMIAGGLALGVAYLIVPVITFLWQHSVGGCVELVRRFFRGVQGRYSEFCRSFREVQTREQQLEAHERASLSQAAREEAERKAAEKTQVETEKHRRYEDLCYGIQLYYDKHSLKLASRFPAERFSDVIATYLSNALPIDVIEERAKQLFETLRECVREAGHRTDVEFTSMSEIAKFFSAKRQEISTLGYDPETLETFQIAINQEEDEAIRRFLGAS